MPKGQEPKKRTKAAKDVDVAKTPMMSLDAHFIYTDKLMDTILDKIIEGKSMSSICREEGMPAPSTVMRWISNSKDLQERYAHACRERTEALMEEMFAIADDSTNDWMMIEGRRVANREVIDRSRLRVDVRKWNMAKMKPKKYGDKIELDGEIRHITPLLGGDARRTEAIEGVVVDEVDNLIEDV